jgi:hypothetical protein
MDFVEYIQSLVQRCGWSLSAVFSPHSVGIAFNVGQYQIPVYVSGFIENSKGKHIIAIRTESAPVQLDDPDGRIFAHTFMEWVLERNAEIDNGVSWSLIEFEGNEKGLVAQARFATDDLTLEVFHDAVNDVLMERVWFLCRVRPDIGAEINEALTKG